MQRVLRISSLVITAVAVLATVAVIVLYALAFNSLGSSGPNMGGFGFLEAADRSVPWIAVLAVLAVITGFAHRSVVVPAASLALASGIVGGLVFGTWTLGRFLSHVDQHAQPPALNSFILTFAGVAYDVAPAAIVLLLGAVVLAGIRGIVVVRARGGRVLVKATA
ncbi:MAG: hypothetical protein WDM88_13095 [Galbitalea sp.]